MRITKACDYALRALVCMSKNPEGSILLTADIAKQVNVSDSFLGKILQNLAKAKILTSVRGKNGGFRLEKKPENISLYDVVTAIEGEIYISDCLDYKKSCMRKEKCNLHNIWQQLQNDIKTKLREVKIEELI